MAFPLGAENRGARARTAFEPAPIVEIYVESGYELILIDSNRVLLGHRTAD